MYFYVAQTQIVEEMKAQLQQCKQTKAMKISQSDHCERRQKNNNKYYCFETIPFHESGIIHIEQLTFYFYIYFLVAFVLVVSCYCVGAGMGAVVDV